MSILNKLDGVCQIIEISFFGKVKVLSQREKLDRLYLRNKSNKK